MRIIVWIASVLRSMLKKNVFDDELPDSWHGTWRATVCISKGCSGNWQLMFTLCTKYFAQSSLSAKMNIWWWWDGRESCLWLEKFSQSVHCGWDPSYLTSVFNNVELYSWTCSFGCPNNQLGKIGSFKAQFSWSVSNIYFTCLNGLAIKM